MKMHNAWLVFKKDWLEIKRNWQVLLPIIVVPIVFSVILPVIIGGIANAPESSMNSGNQDFQALIPNLPMDIQNMLANFTANQSMTYIMVVYFFAPFFLIVPVMASSVIGSDSFAGERERKTIEALLATPISDSELLLGKILVSFIPAMLVTFVSYGLYMAIVDVMTYGTFGMLLLPTTNWLILMLGVTPAIALCSIGLTVMISSKVKGFREAQQISVVLLLPVLGLVFAQISGLVVLGPLILAALIAILAAVDIAIFYVAVKIFRREEILAKQ
jgi:ABC-type Na+ efflux pump permease subunit